MLQKRVIHKIAAIRLHQCLTTGDPTMAEPFLALITPLTGSPPNGGPPQVPSDAHPAHPIAPGGPPPHVAHPIVPSIWPDPPGPPQPPEGGGDRPPPPGGGWAWVAEWSQWGYFPDIGSARPKE